MVRFVLTAICFLGLAASSLANEEGIGFRSGAWQPLKQHGAVRMVRERVDIKVYENHAPVRCEFVFKNYGRPITVTMGFPEEGDLVYTEVSPKESESPEYVPAKGSQLDNFKSWVDGRQVKTRFVGSYRDLGYDGWHVKRIHFGPGQTRKVVDTYDSAIGYVASVPGFSYYLHTGANWKGNIAEAVITADISALPKYMKISAYPPGYKRRGGEFIWVMRNFEPTSDHDIYIGFERTTPRLNGHLMNEEECLYHFNRRGTVMASVDILSRQGLAEVLEDHKSRTCAVSRDGRVLRMKVASTKATVNETEEVKLPVAPIYERGDPGYFVVPIAAVVRALGGTATYNAKTGVLDLHLTKQMSKGGGQSPTSPANRESPSSPLPR